MVSRVLLIGGAICEPMLLAYLHPVLCVSITFTPEIKLRLHARCQGAISQFLSPVCIFALVLTSDLTT